MSTYYVSAASGNNVNAGTSEGAAWSTLTKAMSGVVAGDTVYVKNDGNYNETATISIAGTTTAPISFIGYTSTTGDNGQAIIDAQSSRANCIAGGVTNRIFYVFKNFILASGTGDGVVLGTTGLSTFWKNCNFHNNAGDGFQGGQVLFEKCKFDNNSGHGLNWDRGNILCIGCRFFSNGSDGFRETNSTAGEACILLFCEFFSNNTSAISITAANDTMTVVVGCTIDGDSKDTVTGLLVGTGSFTRNLVCVVNSIFYDCVTGINSENQGNALISRNNLVNSNTTNYTGFQTFTGEITGAPTFNNEGTNDYRPGAGSPLKNVGFDANQLEGF